MTKLLKLLTVSVAVVFVAAPLLAQKGGATTAPKDTGAKKDAPAEAKPEDLPSAESILDRYVEVSGGKEAHLALKNRVIEGKIEIPMANMSGPIKMSYREPNDFRMTVEITGLFTEQGGALDGVAWSTNPSMGPRVLDGAEREVSLREARMHRQLHWRKLYESASTLRMEMVKGKPAYAVELKPATGEPFVEFYSKETGLLVKTIGSLATPMGKMSFEIFLSDYREVDGVKMPFLITRMQMGNEIKIITTNVSHNVEFAEDAFAIPADVQRLIDKANEKKQAGEKAPEAPKDEPKSGDKAEAGANPKKQ